MLESVSWLPRALVAVIVVLAVGASVVGCGSPAIRRSDVAVTGHLTVD
jgi:hypothetical protein